MHYKTALVAAGLASSAAATGWLDQSGYSVPSNTDNKCSDSQAGGYDWSGLDTGSFSNYGSNSFSGFSCGNSFGKRDLLTKRTFQSKCIQGGLDSHPSMSCDHEDDRMSIDEMEISSSHDADIECEYGMPDGSTCREYHSCSSGGSVVKNNQCGGARSVTFKPGRNAPSGCSIGVHSIGFNCNSASSSAPAPTPTSSYVMTPGYTSATAYTTSSAACGYGEDCSSSAPAPSCAYGDDDCSSSATPSSPATTSSAPAPGCAYGDEDCSSSATPSSPASTSSAPAPGCAYGDDDCSVSSSAPATTATPGYTSRCHGEGCSESSTPSSPVTTSAPVSSSSAPAPSCAYGDDDCSSSASSPVSSSPVSSSAPAPSCAYGEEGCESSTQGVPGYTQGTSSTENSPVGTSSPASSKPVTSSPPYPSSSGKSIPVYGTGSPSSSTENSPVSSSSAPNYPEPSCPGVLPKCLKTWLHVTACKDSGDSDCFCKDQQFIKNVHECLPAWADDDEASAAASYLMGLCAPSIPENPGIITNCPSSLTPVATPTYSSKPSSSAPAEVPSSTENSPVGSSAPAEVPSSTENSPVGSSAPPAENTPKTYWSTALVTITSCGPEVTNCPAGSTVVQTTSTPVVSIETTAPASTPNSPVTESAPGSAPPAYSAPAESASSPVSPITTSEAEAPPAYTSPAGAAPPAYSAPAGAPSAPASTPAPSAPLTTVTYSSSVVVPATYTTGVSAGYEVPDSSYTTHLVTTVTVPQVAITTVTVTSNGQETTSVGLGAGSPAPAPATPTAGPYAPPAGYGTGSAGFGTSYIPKPTASGPIEQVGNSGAKTGSSLAGLAVGAVAVVMAL